MNKEFIDKHEAYLLLKQKAETYMLPATKEAYEKAAILIGSLPTIEAEPVKHGRWIEQEHIFGSTLLRYYECSECHVKVLGGERMEFLYCPMCSCRMDGDSK